MINARSSGSLHRQVRRMLILCIAVVVLLSTSVGLGISLYQEVRTRDQLLSNAAQMICTPFTGHPVEGVLLCGTHMSTKGNV